MHCVDEKSLLYDDPAIKTLEHDYLLKMEAVGLHFWSTYIFLSCGHTKTKFINDCNWIGNSEQNIDKYEYNKIIK